MAHTWFTSDLHLGHRKVAELRGFDDPAEHDRVVVQRWTERVRPDDIVWVLGDIAMSRPHEALAIIAELPGTKHLVAGNHDVVSPIHAGAHKHQRLFAQAFDSVQAYAKIRLEGHQVLLSHYPYATDDGQADHGEVRYTQFRLPDEGRWLVHGHTHMADQFVHGRQIHVGLDAHALAPVHIGRIAAILRADQPS